jgi:branched-chain amino acid transport system permease protein
MGDIFSRAPVPGDQCVSEKRRHGTGTFQIRSGPFMGLATLTPKFELKRCVSMTFLNFLISGISLGSIYAIIALGYTMVYGIAKMLNFAHGDVIMVGAYICFFAISRFSLPPLVGILLAMLLCTVLGIVVERLAYKPLRSAPSLAVLITAIGVSYFLQNAALLLWSSSPKVFPNFFTVTQSPASDGTTEQTVRTGIELFGGQLKISFVTIVTIATCVVIMLALTWFTGRTKMGKAMRACSEDKGAAQLMGINVDATISMTFAIGSGLAAVAGVLLCSAYPTLVPTTGSMPGIKAFTAAVFGGIGSIPGALLGGLLLGLIEILAKAYISTQLSDAVVFAVLIVVLLVKPAGLLGKQVREKV